MAKLAGELAKADWVVLQTKRLYGAVTRAPGEVPAHEPRVPPPLRRRPRLRPREGRRVAALDPRNRGAGRARGRVLLRLRPPEGADLPEREAPGRARARAAPPLGDPVEDALAERPPARPREGAAGRRGRRDGVRSARARLLRSSRRSSSPASSRSSASSATRSSRARPARAARPLRARKGRRRPLLRVRGVAPRRVAVGVVRPPVPPRLGRRARRGRLAIRARAALPRASGRSARRPSSSCGGPSSSSSRSAR